MIHSLYGRAYYELIERERGKKTTTMNLTVLSVNMCACMVVVNVKMMIAVDK